jgi:hypothetical protein
MGVHKGRVQMNEIRLRGDDVSTALRDWIKEEVKGAASRAYDLGKFFFAVSAGSIAVITATFKTSPPPGKTQLVSLALLAASMFVAVLMVMPQTSKIDGEKDLLSEFANEVRRITVFVWSWFGLWLLGFGFGFTSSFFH